MLGRGGTLACRQRPARLLDAGYYADWADALLARGWRRLGLRVLSNLAELGLDDHETLRALAYRFEAAGEGRRAADAYERVLRLRPEEPQSHRDLALVLERLGDARRAAGLLGIVARGQWDERFRGIEVAALTELNALLERHRRSHPDDVLDVPLPDAELRRPLDLDLRVVLEWDADATDLDLWVVEPSGELAHARSGGGDGATASGGLVPTNQGGGYGPEEYLLKRALPGTYRVMVRHAGDSRRRLGRGTTAKVTVCRDFGREGERR